MARAPNGFRALLRRSLAGVSPPTSSSPAPRDRIERTAAAGSLRVEVITDPTALPALAAAWDLLLDERSPGAVFRSAAWLVPWWEHLGGGRALRLLVARDGDRLAGVLPAYLAATAFGTRLRLLGDGIVGSDHLGAIARADELPAVAEAFAAHLVEHEGDAALEWLDEDDPLADALARRAWATGARLERHRATPSPFIPLAGRYGDWLAALPLGAGAQIARRRRWLERQRDFLIEVRKRADDVAAGLDDLFRLHAARWAVDGGSDGLRGDDVLAFHRVAARRLADRSWARLWLLHVDGAPRAALYGFQRGGRFAFYQSGHDPAWRARSVGTVLLHAAIEEAFRSGLAEFDLLHGDEPYKAALGAARRQLVSLRLAAGPRARLLRAAESAGATARRWGRAAVPETAVAWVRRRRAGPAW
jgi:CelD/BcsL family acetyltransferase involved in cellulose biosynthesis